MQKNRGAFLRVGGRATYGGLERQKKHFLIAFFKAFTFQKGLKCTRTNFGVQKFEKKSCNSILSKHETFTTCDLLISGNVFCFFQSAKMLNPVKLNAFFVKNRILTIDVARFQSSGQSQKFEKNVVQLDFIQAGDIWRRAPKDLLRAQRARSSCTAACTQQLQVGKHHSISFESTPVYK